MPRLLRALTLLAFLTGLRAPSLATEIYSEGEIVLSLNPGYTIEEVNATWGTTTLDAFPEGGLYLVYAEGVEDLELFAEQMALEDPAVDEAEANYYEDTPEGIRQMVIVAVGGDYVDYEDQEIGQRIGLDEAHALATGVGVTVGVLDTGVDPDHVAFAGRLAPDGYDFVDDDSTPWEEADGLDDDGDGQTDEGFGHGSMVAGIVALVAPGATILPVRVLDDEGRADAYTIAKAVRYAVNHGADVLNMSFGVPRTISTIGHQVSFADSVGVPVVAGAGNDSTDNPVYYPGAHSKAMLITALDSMDVKAGFADWNSKVHVSAPGTGVRSAYPGDQWGLGAGCSFATPFVTGEVALILSLAPYASNDVVEDLVEGAVDPIDHLPGNGPFDGKLGSGRIYLPLALEGVTSGAGDPGVVATRPAARVFPNPSPGAFHFRLPAGSEIGRASIYDAAGRLMRTLVSSGRDVEWDGMDAGGRRAGAGVYYVLIRETASEHRFGVRVVR